MFHTVVVAIAAAAASALACAQGVDVGIVNLVAGDASFTPLAGPAGKVQAFMRVREGDRISVPDGGQVRLVFLESARQERWSGPAVFRATRTQGEPISGKPAEVQPLPAGVPQRISRIPELVQNAKLGGVQVRGLGARPQPSAASGQDPLREARAAYEGMRSAMPADDITPELYLYAALEEFQRYADMQAVVAEMQKRQPDSADVRALAAYVDHRLKR